MAFTTFHLDNYMLRIICSMNIFQYHLNCAYLLTYYCHYIYSVLPKMKVDLLHTLVSQWNSKVPLHHSLIYLVQFK